MQMESYKKNLPLPSGWREYQSRANTPGKSYYHNMVTKQSVWDLEEVYACEEKAKRKIVRPPQLALSSTMPQSRKRKSSFESVGRCKGRRTDDSLASSGYGNSMGTPSATSTSDEMEVCESYLDDSIVMMEIDDLRQNFKQTFDEPNSVDLKKFSEIKEKSTYCAADVQIVYVVIDTNVLLTNLKLLDTLVLLSKDNCKVILIIPWIVLQELDELKDDKRSMKNVQVNRQARAAIRYLHTQLPDSTSSIQGQSIEQATKVTSLIASSNDDHILLCSNSSAILLTNDKNLCCKASSNNCLAFTTDSIRVELANYVKKPPSQPKHIEIVEEKRACSDRTACDIYNSFKLTLFETLSFVVEKVMCFVYDVDNWERIIKIKPPWVLRNVFANIEKHWLAVFGFIFTKQHKKAFESLSDFFTNDRGRKETFDKINSAIVQSVLLCQHLAKRPLQDVLSLAAPVPTAFNIKLSREIEKLSCLSVECKILEESSGKVQESSAEQIEADSNHMNNVKIIFCDVARKIDGICGSVARFFGIAYKYLYDLPPREFTQLEVLNAVTEFNGWVKDLYRQISLVVENPDLQENDVKPLFAAIKAFYSIEEESPIDEFTHTILYRFCVLEENKEYLRRGMCEVHELGHFLQQCFFSNLSLLEDKVQSTSFL
uniref:WW domain-containing protein n=1 Tax=Strigamia maritima TaxID=126957 RepID=T1J7A0_STRMM